MSTLFVDNLAFNTTSADLENAFSHLAPVRFAFVVKKQGSSLSKGVGYVSFSVKDDAQTVLDSIGKDGMNIGGRRIRVRWAKKKSESKAIEPEEPPPPEIESSSEEEEEEEKDRSYEEPPRQQLRRTELLKDKVKEEHIPPPPELPNIESTVFVRNIPFMATEEEVHKVFHVFGPISYVRFTLDPETQRPRGTGFVRFRRKIDADKAVEQSKIIHTETMSTSSQPPKNPFSLPSILTPDPSAGVAKNLVLHGRTLDVVHALTKERAGKLKEDAERAREKQDKRNLYLLREGVILPNSPAAGTISQADLEKRTQSFNTRRAMLRDNPSLYVSKTRLSIRQLPLFVNERILKQLALHSIKAFNKEAHENDRPDLSLDELAECAQADEAVLDAARPKSKKGKAKKEHPKIRQAKIVREADRVDPLTGKTRSRGYGFLEMQTHADALRVLRWANNNPRVHLLFHTWWKEHLDDLMKVEASKENPDTAKLARMRQEMEAPSRPHKGLPMIEFSIENIQVVQRRAQKEKLSQSHYTRKRAPDDTDETPAKRRRISPDMVKPVKTGETKKEEPKPGRVIGSVIGRRRRARKANKGIR